MAETTKRWMQYRNTTEEESNSAITETTTTYNIFTGSELFLANPPGSSPFTLPLTIPPVIDFGPSGDSGNVVYYEWVIYSVERDFEGLYPVDYTTVIGWSRDEPPRDPLTPNNEWPGRLAVLHFDETGEFGPPGTYGVHGDLWTVAWQSYQLTITKVDLLVITESMV